MSRRIVEKDNVFYKDLRQFTELQWQAKKGKYNKVSNEDKRNKSINERSTIQL